MTDSLCQTCWNRWCRALWQTCCVCTGDVRIEAEKPAPAVVLKQRETWAGRVKEVARKLKNLKQGEKLKEPYANA